MASEGKNKAEDAHATTFVYKAEGFHNLGRKTLLPPELCMKAQTNVPMNAHPGTIPCHFLPCCQHGWVRLEQPGALQAVLMALRCAGFRAVKQRNPTWPCRGSAELNHAWSDGAWCFLLGLRTQVRRKIPAPDRLAQKQERARSLVKLLVKPQS